MDTDAPTAVGPVFGPDFIAIVANDETNTQYHLEVYPDYSNPALRAHGLRPHYYFIPQRVYLAKKQSSPKDYDFGMTVFKGLMTSEDTVGVSPAAAAAAGGAVETGGGFCTFSTTFAIPDSVIKNALDALKNKRYSARVADRIAQYDTYQSGDPEPRLGIIPIVSNDVTIEVPQFGTTNAGANPLLISAQGTGKGSVEAAGISSFLVTCNEMAAGAIAGSLKSGMSPFTVHYNLTEQFFLPACEVDVDIDVDKVYASFSAALSASGIFSSASFQAAYENTTTSGGITTTMRINNAAIPDDLKQWIMQNVQNMQQSAMNLVKSEIFDWKPTDGGPAQAGSNTSLLGSLFGGASVAMKASYQKRSVHLKQTLKLDTTIAVSDTKSGDLSDLQPAVKANVDKYLAIVDIGEYFKKVQVAATSAVNWGEKLPDGTSLAAPLSSVMVSAGYPDYSQPLGAGQKPNLKTLAQGYHYQLGSQSNGQVGLAQWSAANPGDIVNISFLRLDKTLSQWPADQVQITKTLVFDASDPRVDLTDNKTTVAVTTTGNDHAPVITGAEVGYLYVRFLVRPLPANVKVTITTQLGPRSDTITITPQNQKNLIWELFSDKYFDQTSFNYSVQVEIDGPEFTDDPIVYSSPQPITVALPPGRVKYVNALSVQLPSAPPDKKAQINDYIARYLAQPGNG